MCRADRRGQSRAQRGRVEYTFIDGNRTSRDAGPAWIGGRGQAESAEARHGDGHGAEALRRADARGQAAGSGAVTLPPRELAGRASRRLGQN